MATRNRRSHSAKGWKRLAPHTRGDRRKLLARCGAKAFLLPKQLKYPVMAKSGPCVVDCTGLRAALSRAARFSPKAKAKAKRLAHAHRCAWSA